MSYHMFFPTRRVSNIRIIITATIIQPHHWFLRFSITAITTAGDQDFQKERDEEDFARDALNQHRKLEGKLTLGKKFLSFCLLVC